MEERAIYVDIDPNDIHDAEPELLFDSHYRAKQIMLDYGTEPLIKAGSPISASGKVSNNASAIGILKRDCYRHLTSVGDVIIGGYIKSDIAQNHSGIEISDAARAAMSRLAFIGADGVPDGHPQSDWNQNDNTQPDYVKNRPFYTGDPVETVLVEESTVSFTESSGGYMAEFQSTFEATVGETYSVSWDGTAYECTCVASDGIPVIGNLSIMGAGSDTGEPFFMDVTDGILIFTADTSASHTISISGNVAPITKIDEKYLPKPYMDKVNPTGIGSFSLNRKSNTDIGSYSFAEGSGTTASGSYSHAEGLGTTAFGSSSHAEGKLTTASGNYSHTEGLGTTASGLASHAEGYYTKASSKHQHVHGKYNIEDTSDTYAHIVGNGTANNARSNAHTLDWSGNAWYAGTVEGKALILPSSTTDSTKKFAITVDDSGAISATAVP